MKIKKSKMRLKMWNLKNHGLCAWRPETKWQTLQKQDMNYKSWPFGTTKKPFIRRSKEIIAIGCKSLVQVTDKKSQHNFSQCFRQKSMNRSCNDSTLWWIPLDSRKMFSPIIWFLNEILKILQFKVVPDEVLANNMVTE
jgi:hypothetical protein